MSNSLDQLSATSPSNSAEFIQGAKATIPMIVGAIPLALSLVLWQNLAVCLSGVPWLCHFLSMRVPRSLLLWGC